MSDFDSILSAARQLPEHELVAEVVRLRAKALEPTEVSRLRLRQQTAVWDSVPEEAEAPFSAEWIEEIDRRIADLDRGTAATVAWSQIREQALARVSHV